MTPYNFSPRLMRNSRRVRNELFIIRFYCILLCSVDHMTPIVHQILNKEYLDIKVPALSFTHTETSLNILRNSKKKAG